MLTRWSQSQRELGSAVQVPGSRLYGQPRARSLKQCLPMHGMENRRCSRWQHQWRRKHEVFVSNVSNVLCSCALICDHDPDLSFNRVPSKKPQREPPSEACSDAQVGGGPRLPSEQRQGCSSPWKHAHNGMAKQLQSESTGNPPTDDNRRR
jgi:hypothetical protein